MCTKIWILLVLSSVACSTAVPVTPTLLATMAATKAPKTFTIQMLMPRAAHSATRLADGRVLLAGGFRGGEEVVTENELFDPRQDRFLPIGRMQNPRVGHTATLLNDGSVLIVGGWSNSQRVDSVEMFDPRANKFQLIERLNAPRADHTATLMADGRVLIVGGFSASNAPQPKAEIFDPTTKTFRIVGSLATARSGHTATLLTNRKVLIVGGTTKDDGVTASAELFDPMSETFMKTGDLSVRRRKHAAVLLKNNKVMIVGGTDERDWSNPYGTTDIYDVATQRFVPGPALQETRFKLQDAALMLPSGNALIAGGDAVIEVFDANANQFIRTGALDKDYFFSTATLLEDGRVLIAGGYDRRIQATQQAWLYK